VNRFVISLAALMAMVPPAHADTNALAESKQCFSCHAMDKEMPKAPSFKAIAKKYKGMANAEVMLARKVQVGGEGHWGAAPMPASGGARPVVSEAEAKELVGWVLSQK
jgi:cytochrome c